MRRQLDYFLRMVMVGLLPLSLAGCPPKKKKMAVEAPPEQLETKPPEAAPLEIGDEWVLAPKMSPVYFDTNKADLRDESRAALKKNAEVLKVILQMHPAVLVRMEGHGDERGTLEYNLALGERRAKAVQDYYGSLGIAKPSLSTISYGEEKPVCAESSEDCWWKNRRGETTLKSPSGPVQVPLDKLP